MKNRFFFTKSIQGQFIFGMILTNTLLTIILVYILNSFQKNYIENKLVDDLFSYIYLIEYSVIPKFMNQDLMEISENVQRFKNIQDLRYIIITDRVGQILGHTDLLKVGLYLNDNFSKDLLKKNLYFHYNPIVLINNENILEVAKPISVAQTHLGWIRLSINKNNIQNIILSQKIKNILIGLSITLFGILFSLFIGKILTKRLNDLRKSIDFFKKTQKIQISKTFYDDNLESVATSLKNFMSDIIEKDTIITDYQKELEKKIEDRTHELDKQSEYLKNIKNELQMIFDHIPGLIYYKDDQNNFIRVNDYTANLYRLDKKDLERRSLWDLVSPEMAQKLFEDDLKILSTNMPILNIEEKLEIGEKEYWFLTSKIPIYEREKSSRGILIISMDITDKKLAELRLEEYSIRFKKIFEESTDGIAMIDGKNARFLMVNNSLCHILGYSREELLSLTVPDITQTLLKDSVFSEVKQKLTSVTKEMKIFKKNKEPIWISISSSPIYLQNNFFISSIIRDITYKKLAEQKIYESEKKFRTIFESSPDGNIILDHQHKIILLVNQNMAKMLDISTGTLLSFPFVKLAPEYGPEKIYSEKKFDDLCEKALSEGTSRFEWPLKKFTGELFWADLHISTVSIDQKNYLFVAIRDISEFKRLQEDLTQTNRDLEQFAYIASHDLQEPLRSMTSFAHLLEEELKGKLTKESAEYLHFILSGTTQMRHMVTDLLTYSKEFSRPISLYPISFSDCCHKAILNLSDLIEKSHATIENRLEASYPMNDSGCIQLFQNFISNAIKYSKENRPPHIILWSEVQGNELLVHIKDNGIGIEAKFYNKIFELFKRLHPLEDKEGTGIGLAICKKIVERYQGKIWVSSKVGEGSTFTFSLPIITS